MDDFYVYAHYKLGETIPFYIGKGRGTRAYQKTNRSIFWHNVVNVYGFEVKILYNNLNEEAAVNTEIQMIKEHGRRDVGTGCLVNLTDGGDGRRNIIVSQETRQKVSKSNTGKTRSDECKAKISESNRRRTVSDETKRKISESLRGKTASTETKEKMSKARIGKKHTTAHPLWSETRKKAWSDTMRGENNPMYGKQRTDATRDVNGRFA